MGRAGATDARRLDRAAPVLGHRSHAASSCTGHRLGLLIEDLHWADTTTLDLIEHLAARGTDIPVLGTWRLDDPTINQTNLAWFTRVRRSSSVTFASARRAQPG